MSAIYNISIEQGARYRSSVFATDLYGNAINLSGYSARAVIKNRYSSTGILIDLNPTVDNSYISGIVNFDIPATGTAALPFGLFVYDLEIYSSTTDVLKILKGTVTVSNEVTT